MRRPWGQAALCAGGISVFVLGLFYYWFGVADRYAVFLYEHLGSTPFDAVTSSRYWMAGLVAAGMLLVFSIALHGLLGRLRPGYHPPAWPRVWLLCAPFLLAGIPLITMTLNAPTLPAALAFSCALAALAGVALAIWPAEWAARRPLDLILLGLDGAGLMLPLLLLRALEAPGRGLHVSPALSYTIAAGSLLAGAGCLIVTTLVRRWRRRSMPGAGALLAAGACVAYLLMPLAHHLFFTPAGYSYISTASNFFTFDLRLQAATWVVVIGLAVGISRLGRAWQRSPANGI